MSDSEIDRRSYKSTIPEDAKKFDHAVYSNFDHEIKKLIARELERENGKAYATHTAWNFVGYVWHIDGKWYNEIWINNTPRRLISGKTLLHVISEANDLFGKD